VEGLRRTRPLGPTDRLLPPPKRRYERAGTHTAVVFPTADLPTNLGGPMVGNTHIDMMPYQKAMGCRHPRSGPRSRLSRRDR
jgi:hypothetical protein